MSERANYTRMLRERVRPSWSSDREERVRERLERALSAQARGRRAVAVAALSLAAAVAVVLGLWREQPERASLPAPAPPTNTAPSGVLRLTDGSEVTLVSGNARVEALPGSSTSVAMRLAAGTARFSVTPRPEREFSVLAGHVHITVLGTVFTVAVDDQAVHVNVERGRVRVSHAHGERELAPGERARFPREAPVPAAAPPSNTAVAPEPLASDPRPTPRPWRTLAEEGDYAAALARLSAEGPNAIRDTPEDLLLAADVARLGGQPEKAVAPLERLLRRHPNDARAPLAAFTLGRTLLDQLGRPREAARAFRTAQQRDAAGALAEDALAREVESWSRAGETELARERAREFLTRYPHGRRAAAVRRLSGVE
ncbi:MAG TPA: FecR domain-containing protein [Polyangiaceae bacterium]|nr:FecR domain-containing protein [Polyangiaceae bacterium]